MPRFRKSDIQHEVYRVIGTLDIDIRFNKKARAELQLYMRGRFGEPTSKKRKAVTLCNNYGIGMKFFMSTMKSCAFFIIELSSRNSTPSMVMAGSAGMIDTESS